MAIRSTQFASVSLALDSDGSGGDLLYEVPAGFRALIKFLAITSQAVGASGFTELYVQGSTAAVDLLRLYGARPPGSTVLTDLYAVLDEGQSLSIYVEDYTPFVSLDVHLAGVLFDLSH